MGRREPAAEPGSHQLPHCGRGNLTGGELRIRGLDIVHQFHDGGNAGVEVPAALEIVRDLGNRLVQLSQQFERKPGGCG